MLLALHREDGRADEQADGAVVDVRVEHLAVTEDAVDGIEGHRGVEVLGHHRFGRLGPQSITLPLKPPDSRRFCADSGYGSRRRSNVSSAVTSCTGLSTADLQHRRTDRHPATGTVTLTV